MEKIDLRKQYKHLYNPSAKKVEVVDVPPLQFAMVDGMIPAGEGPGDSADFQQAVDALYSISYTLKFMFKKREEAPIDYPVMALEGLWTTASNNSRAVDYVIQYAWVPNIYLAGNYSLAGSGMDAGARVGSQASGVVPENARHILRGFELGYNDSHLSAQNLRDFGVHMAPGTGAAEREIVSWQDNDRAEHIKWKVDYSALK